GNRGRHRRRRWAVRCGAIAELVAAIVSPTVRLAGGRETAGTVGPRAHGGEAEARGDGRRRGAEAPRRAVAQLTESVVTPAYRAASRPDPAAEAAASGAHRGRGLHAIDAEMTRRAGDRVRRDMHPAPRHHDPVAVHQRKEPLR